LDNDLTPNNLFFVRNNGIPPTEINLAEWKIEVSGESVLKQKTYTLSELKTNFKQYTYNITLECGGNGRSEFNPPAKGNQWKLGAVGCAAWTGIRVADLLNDVGLNSDAVYIGYYGKDTHLSGDLDKVSISRGVPISKALQPESLLAWSMNGQDLPLMNGHPLRLVFGGFPASTSGKWVNKIVVRNRVHDGAKMGGQSYRVPCNPVAPGSKVADEDMCIIEDMPVKSLLTFPKTGATILDGQQLPIRGYAWTAAQEIKKVEYSIDFGQSWMIADLSSQSNRYAWQKFSAHIKFPKKGYYEIWAKATDSDGISQPMLLPGWNPRGYLNNACHRIAIKVVKG
jgi:DMSO/TMAO reductase YedYZ molybdopterin-dependent catalytic subunit